MANLVYNRGKYSLAKNAWDGASTYRVLLATGAYTPSATHNVVADVTNELSGGGYTRKDITNRTIVEDDGNNRADLNADNVSWNGLSSTQTYRWAIVFRLVTNDSDSELITAIDVTGRDLTGLTDYTLKWDGQAANGRVLSLT